MLPGSSGTSFESLKLVIKFFATLTRVLGRPRLVHCLLRSGKPGEERILPRGSAVKAALKTSSASKRDRLHFVEEGNGGGRARAQF